MPRRSQPRVCCRGALFAHPPALAVGCGPGSCPCAGVRGCGSAVAGLCSPTHPPWLWAAGCGPRSYPCPGVRSRGSAAVGLCSPTHRRSQPQARCSRPRFAHPAALRLASAGVPPRAQPPHPPAAGSSTEQGGRGAPRRQLRAIVPPGRHGWAQRHLVSAEPRNQPDPSTSAGCPTEADPGTNLTSAGPRAQQAPTRAPARGAPACRRRHEPQQRGAPYATGPGTVRIGAGPQQGDPGTHLSRTGRPTPSRPRHGTPRTTAGPRLGHLRYRHPSAGPRYRQPSARPPVPATVCWPLGTGNRQRGPATGNPQPRPRLGSTSPARRSASAIALLAGAGAWREAPPPPPRP